MFLGSRGSTVLGCFHIPPWNLVAMPAIKLLDIAIELLQSWTFRQDPRDLSKPTLAVIVLGTCCAQIHVTKLNVCSRKIGSNKSRMLPQQKTNLVVTQTLTNLEHSRILVACSTTLAPSGTISSSSFLTASIKVSLEFSIRRRTFLILGTYTLFLFMALSMLCHTFPWDYRGIGIILPRVFVGFRGPALALSWGCRQTVMNCCEGNVMALPWAC